MACLRASSSTSSISVSMRHVVSGSRPHSAIDRGGRIERYVQSSSATLKLSLWRSTDACRELSVEAKITFIVVGKRHHIRFVCPSHCIHSAVAETAPGFSREAPRTRRSLIPNPRIVSLVQWSTPRLPILWNMTFISNLTEASWGQADLLTIPYGLFLLSHLLPY
jgi:hypothetical protein